MAKKLSTLLKNRVISGLTGAARFVSTEYQKEVIKVTHPEFPTGDPPGSFKFPPPHSKPGEYPFRETGKGQTSIDFIVRQSTFEAAVGTRPIPEDVVKGLTAENRLAHLRLEGDRLGVDHVVTSNLPQVRQAFIDGAREF